MLGKGAILCINLGMLGTLGETNWFPNLDKQKGYLTFFFAKISCFSKQQEECLLTGTTQTTKNAGV